MSGLEHRTDLLEREAQDHGENLHIEKPDNYGNEDERCYGNYNGDD
jgi:hypothetical protein